jgi:hypothetical protein
MLIYINTANLGHGPAAQQPPPQQHGHSHGGKPCHGHGPAAQQQPQQQHGHSHGAQPQQHGHSHGGKPCHGHGPQAGAASGPPAQPSTPEEVEMKKKQLGIKLFMEQMFGPKIALVWAKFHKNESRDASKATFSSGLSIPFVEGETMNREEFRDFIESFLLAQARGDGHRTVRLLECLQFEMQALFQLGFQDATKGPDIEVAIPYEKFKGLAHQLVMMMCIRKYDTMKFIMEELGLGSVKLPNLPQMSVELEPQRIREYSREKIMPLLIQFVVDNAEGFKDDANAAVASGFVACTQSIKAGVKSYVDFIKTTKLTTDDEKENPPSEDELSQRWNKYVSENLEDEATVQGIIDEIDNLEKQAIAHPDQVLQELKHHPSDLHYDSDLIAQNIQVLVVLPLLAENPVALKHIAKQWAIDLQIQIEGEGEGEETSA